MRRTSIIAVALVASAAMATVPSSAGAAEPGNVTLTPGGSVDCASGTSTVELTLTYMPSSDIGSVEIDGGTATLEGSSEGPQNLTFEPGSLTPADPSASTAVIGVIGVSVTVEVDYTVHLLDGSTHESQAALVLDAVRPADVCPTTTTTTTTSSTTSVASTTTVTPSAAEPAQPRPAEPDYTG